MRICFNKVAKATLMISGGDMSERFSNGFVPDFEQGLQAPQHRPDLEALGGAGAIAPFGFDAEHSTPVVEGGFDVGPAEIRTTLKSREDNTSTEYLPL